MTSLWVLRQTKHNTTAHKRKKARRITGGIPDYRTGWGGRLEPAAASDEAAFNAVYLEWPDSRL